MQNVNKEVIEQFRGNDGVISSGMFKGARLLLLTTTGAKSGKTRVNPLAFSRDGGSYVVIASKGGAPTHPDWYHNVVANPDVTVDVATGSGTKNFKARARVAEGDERQRLYDAQAAIMPGFADYQRKTTRQIPVVVTRHRSKLGGMSEPTIVFAPMMEPDVRAIADELRPTGFAFVNVSDSELPEAIQEADFAVRLHRSIGHGRAGQRRAQTTRSSCS